MNLTLFLIILIALIIIFCIILYNGIRILLTVGKEKGIVNYEFKVTLLKIPIFKRKGTKEIIGSDDTEDQDEDLDTEEEESKPEEKSSKTINEDSKEEKSVESEDEEEEEEDKGLKEKYKEIKPILKELKKSKDELKSFLKNILKAINIKRLEGNLIIGLSDHASTIKIASWIWSIGAIVNGKKSTLLTVEPRFTEIIADFEGKLELKINILLLIIYSLLLLTKKNIRELIKVIYKQYISSEEEDEEKEKDGEEAKEGTVKLEEDETSKNKETEEKIKEENEIKEKEPNEEEDAVTQVKQLMKIVRSDWYGWKGNNK